MIYFEENIKMMISSPLSNIKFVNRLEYICSLCQNKSVLHLGATDSPCTQKSIESDTFLHLNLMKISKEVIGIDLSIDMINWLQENHNITNIKCTIILITKKILVN